MNRRHFLSKVVVLSPLALWIACTKKKETLSEDELKKLREGAKDYHDSIQYVPEGNPIAKALGYVQSPDANTAPDRKEKEGVAAEDQSCENCHFYVIKEGKPYGECQLLLGKGMVKAQAWCKSWAPARKAS
ncbi:MAG: high-potential iron-sulfur protein [Bdellovibrionota bacterium]